MSEASKDLEFFLRAKSAAVAICLVAEDGTLVPYGSGINVHPNGAVLTCKHVIEGAQPPLPTGDQSPPIPRPAEGLQNHALATRPYAAVFTVIDKRGLHMKVARPLVVAGPHDYDIAVMRLKSDELLPHLDIGDSDQVQEGQPVVTYGYPLGPLLQPGDPIGSLLAKGVVSAIRPHPAAVDRHALLLDMTLNPGNSGGGLLDLTSQTVVGIINSEVPRREGYPSGIGGAVPVNKIKNILDAILIMSEVDIKSGRVIDDMRARNAVFPRDVDDQMDPPHAS